EHYRSAFEGNIYESIEKNKVDGKLPEHGDECDHELDWWPEYENSFEKGVSPFQGVIPVIRELAADYRLIIVTSGSARFIVPFLERTGVADCFIDILDVDVHTHKTKKIEMILDKYATSAPQCVFITDTLGDVREAAHHTIGSIAVTWGFHPRETLEKGVPFRIVDSPAEIPGAVSEYFS
ncbi:HAD-IA family hydrolase, partial [Candidatus Kaiserbacteria bacterium]|nr:HAD-IA family hydrolase [Candidatus Kaiserbacteria bacterium]